MYAIPNTDENPAHLWTELFCVLEIIFGVLAFFLQDFCGIVSSGEDVGEGFWW
jgi:hypothetical protein